MMMYSSFQFNTAPLVCWDVYPISADARNRIGGWLRTIDLMLDSVDDWKEEEESNNIAAGT